MCGNTAPSRWDRRRGRPHTCSAAPATSAPGVPAAAGLWTPGCDATCHAHAPTPGDGTKATKTGRAHGRVATGTGTRLAMPPHWWPQREAVSRCDDRPPARCRPWPNPWGPGGSVTGLSPARSTGPGGTTWARQHLSTARAITHVAPRRWANTRWFAAAWPGACCRTVRKRWVRVRRPVVRRVPSRRTRQRWSGGVEHVGRRMVRRGHANVGRCMSTLLPWGAFAS
jgi:hypothetical protein